MSNPKNKNMDYLYFALLTVCCWGTYGVCMHIGSVEMADKEHGRLMAFIWVGLAYFLTAIIAPLIIFKIKGAPLNLRPIQPKVGNGLSLPGHSVRSVPSASSSPLARCLHPLTSRSSCPSSLPGHRL